MSHNGANVRFITPQQDSRWWFIHTDMSVSLTTLISHI